MRYARTKRSAPHRQIAPTDNIEVFKTVVLASQSGAFPAPTASLIEQKPGDVVRSHFHMNSQFQVFVHGSGTLGRTPVAPFVVQYVAPHTGYGPIIAGPEGIWYMTLRPSFPTAQPGYKPVLYLPESRPVLDMSRPKFQTHTDIIGVAADGLSELQVDELWPASSDGLAAWRVRLPAGASIPKPEHPGGLASYTLVASGALLHDGESLPFLSTIWSEQGEAVTLTAGPGGADIFVMQFPGDAT